MTTLSVQTAAISESKTSLLLEVLNSRRYKSGTHRALTQHLLQWQSLHAGQEPRLFPAVPDLPDAPSTMITDETGQQVLDSFNDNRAQDKKADVDMLGDSLHDARNISYTLQLITTDQEKLSMWRNRPAQYRLQP